MVCWGKARFGRNRQGMGFKKCFGEKQMKLAALAMAIVLMVGCTDNHGAVRILEAQGYTKIEMTGYKPFACSKDDTLQTGFKAEINGRTVSGTVCSGLFFKGNTIRFD